MKTRTVAMVITILVVAGLGVGYLAAANNGANTQTKTPTTSTTASRQSVSITTRSLLNGQPIPVSSVETANMTIGDYRSIAFSPNSSRIYVAGGSSLLVIDASSHSVIANITLPGTALGGIAMDDNANIVYVSVSGEVAEINGSTNAVVGKLPLDFSSLAYNPSTHIIYGFSAAHEGLLIGADVRTGSIVANISVGPPGWSGAFAMLNPRTNMVYTVGCEASGLVCLSPLSIVNRTSETLVTTIHSWNSGDYPTMAVDSATNVVYVSGLQSLLALNGTNGDTIFDVNPLACAPFPVMAVVPSSNQVLMVPQFSDYLLVYNGTSGSLVNMYSFPSPISPLSLAFDPVTDELYVTTDSGQLVAFRDVAATGNVNNTLVGSGQDCPRP